MCVLKIANLERSKLSNIDKIYALFEWMEHETFFNAIAAALAILYFGPNRKRPLLKGVNTKDKDRLKENIFSAAWDMTYIRYWSQRRVKTNTSEAWILCTHDYALYRIANSLLTDDHAKEADDNLKSLFVENWNVKVGNKLFEKFNNAEIASIIDAPGRDTILEKRFREVDSQIDSQEVELGLNQ